jgi:hypothetical protein
MDEFAVGANFEGSALRWDKRERRDAFSKFKNFGRQTDGLRRVVSNYTIFDRDFSFQRALLSRERGYRVGRGGSRCGELPAVS